MMRRCRVFLIALLWLPAIAAAAIEARVVDMAGSEVVVEFDSAPGFVVGDTLELSYMAGFLDMLLGSYRVRDQQGPRMTLSTLSSSSPPSKGMRVMVSKATPLRISASPVPTPQPPVVAGEGRVVGVRGNTVELEFPAGTPVRVDDRFSLAFEAPRVGRVAIAGTWQVKRIDANRAQVEAEGAAGQARIGQVAIAIAPVAAPAAQPTLPSPQSPRGVAAGSLFPNPPAMSFDEFLARYPSAPPPSAAPVAAASWIGLHMQGLTPDLAQTLNLPVGTAGILVADLTAGGPAEQAGLQSGDVILDVDGRELAPHQLAEQVRQSAPGTLLRLRIWRDGKRMFIAVRTAAKP